MNGTLEASMNWKSTEAVAFLRVSSQRQKDNTSHETQEQEIKDYCREQGLELVRTVRMVESAKDSKKRTKYIEGIAWALKNKVQHVVFYIFDRETRNLTDNERNEYLVKSGTLVIHYAKEGRVYHAESSDSDFFMRDVQAVTNKQFSRQLSTKVIDAMQTKAESGWFPGNWPPLGYVHQKQRDSEGKEMKRGTIIVPDPIEKNIRQVQREFELRAGGMSCEQIRFQIIREGFIPSSKVPEYHRSSIEKRLRNPFYWGEFIWRGQRHLGKHDLIISQSVLSRVGETVGFRQAYQRKPVHGDHGHFGGGWITCADKLCGCHIVYDPKRKALATGETKTFHYYHCTNGKRVHATLKGMSVSEASLWEQFGQAVGSITISKELAEAIADVLNESHKQMLTLKKREVGNYRDGLAALEHDEDAVYTDLKKGLIDEAMFQRQIKRIRSERARFTDLLEQANASLDGSYLETAQSILELATDAKSLWESRNDDERLDFLKQILSNQKLDGVNVRYELRKPYSTLALLKEKEEWRSVVDRFRTDILQLAA
jgi:site-specific DNA recombinase